MVRPDELDEMGSLSIALPPEAWRELLLEPWPVEQFPAWAHGTRAAIRGALRRAGASEAALMPRVERLAADPEQADSPALQGLSSQRVAEPEQVPEREAEEGGT